MIRWRRQANGSSRASKATSTITRSRETSAACGHIGYGEFDSGGGHYSVEARSTASSGPACIGWLNDGFPSRDHFILIPSDVLPPVIRHKSRMRYAAV